MDIIFLLKNYFDKWHTLLELQTSPYQTNGFTMSNPYESPQANLSHDALYSNKRQKYAGFWPRAIAMIADSILWTMIALPLLYLIYGESYFSSSYSFLEPQEIITGPFDLLINWVIPILLVIAFWYYKQATPAKMLLKMKIVDAKTGEPPTLTQCIIRYVAYIPSTLIFLLGFLWVAWDDKKQGWHDKLAGTVVIFPHYKFDD